MDANNNPLHLDPDIKTSKIRNTEDTGKILVELVVQNRN